jgi:hypothetical protein
LKTSFASVRAVRSARRPRFLILALLLATGPGLPAQPAPAAAPAASPALTPEQVTALKALDADIARLDAVLEKLTEPRLHTLTKSFLDVFKETRATLGITFDQVKHDELKFEVIAEFQRMSLWLAAPRTTPIVPHASPGIVFELDPSPESAAEVKAALAALDEEIKRTEAQVGRLTAVPARAAALERLKTIQETRAALGRNFTKAGWIAVLADLKGLPPGRGNP